MAIVFSHVNVAFQDRQVLYDVCLHLKNMRIACVGSNGSGKSTLAKVACGILPFAGSIKVYGKEIAKKQVWKDVNMCFQIPENQIIMPSVEEELRFGLVNTQFSDEQIKTKIEYALSLLKTSATQPCHTLSEGKKRMLCLLSIILMEPKSIFLDEPTTFLDVPSKKMFLHFLESVTQQVIFITQELDIVKTFSHAFCIHEGRVQAQGTGTEVVKEYKKLW